jgi:hypothetical protein
VTLYFILRSAEFFDKQKSFSLNGASACTPVQEHEGEPEGEGEGGEGDRQGEELRPGDDNLAEKQFKILVDLIDKVSTRLLPKKLKCTFCTVVFSAVIWAKLLN